MRIRCFHLLRLFALRRSLASEQREVGQGVGELLSRHRGVGKHACAEWPSRIARALLVSLQVQYLQISQIDRCRIELSDERGGIGCELRSLVLVPITAMAVVAQALSVEDRPALLGIACRLCVLRSAQARPRQTGRLRQERVRSGLPRETTEPVRDRTCFGSPRGSVRSSRRADRG